MDIIEQLMTDIYDNRQSYKENDYIIICNILKEFYDKVKGNPLTILNDKGFISDDEEDYDEVSSGEEYGDSYLGDDGYIGRY